MVNSERAGANTCTCIKYVDLPFRKFIENIPTDVASPVKKDNVHQGADLAISEVHKTVQRFFSHIFVD